jgi:hypothetical protein
MDHSSTAGRADDKPAARREVGENVAQLLSGLRIDNSKG